MTETILDREIFQLAFDRLLVIANSAAQPPIGDMLAEKTRHLPHDAYSPTREISSSSFW